jgi:hypothetical protein
MKERESDFIIPKENILDIKEFNNKFELNSKNNYEISNNETL